jgi:tRNA pseudouridine65 synthase
MVKCPGSEYSPDFMEFPILYEDHWLAIIRKPAGMHVHPTPLSPGEPSVQPLLRDQLGCPVHPVHRLDRPTSGVLVFAKDQATAAGLGGALRGKSVVKVYQALVRGWFPPRLVADSPLDDEDHAEPRPARTAFHCLAHHELPLALGAHATVRTSLVLALPETGRRHQIRRHLARSAHPVIGDTGYGDRHHNHFFQERFALPHLQLFAVGIGFHHPHGGGWLSVWDEPSGDAARILDMAAAHGARRLLSVAPPVTPDLAARLEGLAADGPAG